MARETTSKVKTAKASVAARKSAMSVPRSRATGRKPAVVANDAQREAGKVAAAKCVKALKNLMNERELDGKATKTNGFGMPVILTRKVLAQWLPAGNVHKGAVQGFHEAIQAKGWTMAPRDGGFHEADEWKLTKIRGGLHLRPRHLSS